MQALLLQNHKKQLSLHSNQHQKVTILVNIKHNENSISRS